jgi:ParB-like chromosome segregation protein Spo0J
MQEPVEPFVSLKFVAVENLVPYARNARTHSPSQVAQLAASILEWGWTNPILADDRGVVAGHGRLEAARLLYSQGKTLRLPNGEPIPSGEIPVLDVSGWSESKRRAYVLADNKLALGSGWNEGMLAEELRSLTEDGFDLSLVGFDDMPSLSDLDDLSLASFDSVKSSKTEEIDESKFDLEHRCPACGFEFNDD